MAITYQGATVEICPNPQANNLNQAAFEALTYDVVGKVVNAPQFMVEDTIASQNTLDTEIVEKQKTISSGNDTECVVSFETGGNVGHDTMEAAAASSGYYAVRLTLDDSLGTNGTTVYARFVIGGGGIGGGGANEDFVTRTYQMAMTSQRPVEVAAA